MMQLPTTTRTSSEQAQHDDGDAGGEADSAADMDIMTMQLATPEAKLTRSAPPKAIMLPGMQ